MSTEKLIVVLGPTASGKSELAKKLVKEFGGEIVSADSRQIYKGMDIGTAKQKNSPVPHHLIDILKPNQKFNVTLYKKLAVKKIKEILDRGKLPFLAGGTGFYIKSVVDGIIIPEVKPDWKLRKQLDKKAISELASWLKKLDPVRFRTIDVNNRRRLIRALEIVLKTNRPVPKPRKAPFSLDILIIGIKTDKEELKNKIVKRVKKMIGLGLKKEVEVLTEKYGWEAPAFQSIGYQEWKGYFERKKSLEEVKNEIIKNTWQYAKRQLTWFKKDKRIRWVKNYEDAENLVLKFIQ
ncbi:MAG: tRNA (adenosine(37)-N6)-dimethylallyltransferase MiaA [Candidatus Nealsonbacteria bacterium]|nr:tRNA (adenosine(37)-N6)-dimethylallyltransferase MiaA [Candidatus Nealsonbacteria bacterium]